MQFALTIFSPLLSQMVLANQNSKLDSRSLEKLSNITAKASDQQIISLGIDPNSFPASGGQPEAINLDQIKESLSSESLNGLTREQTMLRLKTSLELYNRYFQENFQGEEYQELRNHLNQRLLTSPYTTNLHRNINDSTDLGKIKQTCNEIGEFFSIIALKVEAIKSGDQASDSVKEKEELKTLLTIFPSNQNADYACLDGTRQRLQTGTFSLFKQDVITQLFEQEIDIFVSQHANEVKEGNQIHMKTCLYGAISSLPNAELAKIDGFFLNPQDGLQLKDVVEFVDNLDDKIIKGLKTRISEIEIGFEKQFKESIDKNQAPNAGAIKDFNSFLKINGFKEIDDTEFYEIFCDGDYLITKDSKDKLRIELLKSITATYPTLDKAKLEELFVEGTQQQYLSTKIDLFYDDPESSQQLDVNKIGNLIAIFRDNSAGASSSQRPEPNIANIEKGLIVLRDVAQNFKNSNPFYFLEFFKQFETSTGATFEDYFFEPSSQDQSQPSQSRQQREVKTQFKELEGIIKDITRREKNLSDILLQKPVDQTIVQSPQEIALNQEIFDVCNAIFLGKEDEESEKKILAFKEKLLSDPSLADDTYSFFLARESIFIKKLIESDNDKALAKLIDILPREEKDRLREYKPDGSNNLLHIASIVGSSKVIGALNSAGFDVNQVNSSGNTPLMLASQMGHISAVEALIKAGAEIKPGADVDLQIKKLIESDNDKALAKLIDILPEDHKNRLKEYRPDGSNNLIHIASIRGSSKVIGVLKNAGFDVNQVNSSRYTALMIASQIGNISAVKALIDEGANVDLQDSIGDTALMHASCFGRTEVVEALIEAKASVDLLNNNKNTALMLASKNGHTLIVEALINAEAKPNIVNKNYYTALLFATENGHTLVVNELLKMKEIDVNLKYELRRSPLILASIGGHIDILRKLIENGADINSKDFMGNSCLLLASKLGNISVVEELLKVDGIDIKAKNGHDETALKIAIYGGRHLIVNALLKNGLIYKDIEIKFRLEAPQESKEIIVSSISKYKKFLSRAKNERVLLQVKNALEEYLSGDKDFNETTKINIMRDGDTINDFEVELNFNGIKNIYKKEIGCFNWGDDLKRDIQRLVIKVEKKREEQNQPSASPFAPRRLGSYFGGGRG